MKNVIDTDLTGKVAVVTGASGTLCSIFAMALARAGAKVALLGRNLAKLNEVADKIAAIMGVSAGAAEKKVAFVKCKGTCDKANVQYNYYGIDDCVKIAAAVPGSGSKACSYGCLGSGSCVKACPFDAIHIVDGIAVVDKEACKACGKCIAKCPHHLIELAPYEQKHLVQCSSKDKGKDVMSVCSVGCIGCKMCEKVCESDAVHVVDNIAHIDPEKCTNCGKCAEKCPKKIIK